ncbi:hypothetical protein C0J52_12937, partial [Blattella germanica]
RGDRHDARRRQSEGSSYHVLRNIHVDIVKYRLIFPVSLAGPKRGRCSKSRSSSAGLEPSAVVKPAPGCRCLPPACRKHFSKILSVLTRRLRLRRYTRLGAGGGTVSSLIDDYICSFSLNYKIKFCEFRNTTYQQKDYGVHLSHSHYTSKLISIHCNIFVSVPHKTLALELWKFLN